MSVFDERMLKPFILVFLFSFILLVNQVYGTEPAPGHDRITMEALIYPEHVSQATTPVYLCLTNVNRRAGSGQALVPEDAWIFRIPDGCGTFAQVSGDCSLDLSINSSSVQASDFACSVVADTAMIVYQGAPNNLAYEESICLVVDYTPSGTEDCVVEYRSLPRTTVFGPYQPEGVGRMNQPHSPSFIGNMFVTDNT
ncbi:hypothetical protein ACFLU6_12755, partial [Acidobacteriota bacterium]